MSDLYEVDPLMVEQTIEDWVTSNAKIGVTTTSLTTLTALTNTTDLAWYMGPC